MEMIEGVPIYDRQGKRITMGEFLGLCNQKNRRVCQTILKNHIWVSTVWLGIDHNWGFGEPLIFETMAFLTKGGRCLDYQERYSTEKQAIAGHSKAVRLFRNLKTVNDILGVKP